MPRISIFCSENIMYAVYPTFTGDIQFETKYQISYLPKTPMQTLVFSSQCCIPFLNSF